MAKEIKKNIKDIKNNEYEGDVFKNNRIVYFNGIFDEDKAKDAIKTMLEYELENYNKDIIIYIDSRGGEIDSFIAIHDVIKMLRCDVATLCIGKAMSAGQLLLMSGTKGKRFITRNSRVLMHQLRGATYGSYAEMDNDLQENKRLQNFLESICLDYTNLTKRKLKKLMSKDSFITPKKAVKYGIADHIANNNEEIFSLLKQ